MVLSVGSLQAVSHQFSHSLYSWPPQCVAAVNGISPVEFHEKMDLLEKITIELINCLSYAKVSQEYETDRCQAVSLEEKKL